MIFEEVWMPIDGAPNYEVSSEMRVRNVRTGRILKYSHPYYRPRVLLMIHGERVSAAVEDLAFDAFNRDPETGEIWQTVGDAWNYEVSDRGRVRNRHTGRILRPYYNSLTGRPQVTMMDAGVRITRQVRSLVSEAFGREIANML